MEEIKVNPNELTTSTRKRPNKAKLLKQAAIKGHLTPNENLMIVGLNVKNLLQRINTRAFEDVILPSDCKKLEAFMNEYITKSEEVLSNYVIRKK